MKKLGVIFLALLMALSACLPGLAAGADGLAAATLRNAELSAFTDGNGHIYISGLGTPVNATPAKEIVSIDAYRILFFAQEDAAAGIPATRLIMLTLDALEETVVTDDAADACVVGDHVCYLSAADALTVQRYAMDTGTSEPACQSKEAIERLYAVSEGVVAVLAGGESAYIIDEDGYTVYNREIAAEYAVYDGFDLYATVDGSLYACAGAESVLLDSNVAAWVVMQDTVYYLTQNAGLLSLKCYDPETNLWRVILPVCRNMQAQLTASQTLLFMLSEDNTVYTVNVQTGALTQHTALPAMDSYILENGAAVESYRIEAVSGQLNVLGVVRQAESAPAFTFVQYAGQPAAAETAHRLLAAYVIQDEDTVYALLQPAEQYSLLQYGSRGEAVSAIQEPLLQLGYYDYRVDGIYGWRTENAIELLQADLGLTVTGAADADLQKLILSGTLEPYNPYRILAQGDRGLRVQTMQQKLRALGYLADGADGIFGARTKAALSLFQRENNLNGSGVADEGTLKLLYSGTASACSVYIELVRGDSGYRVRELNDRLKQLYYLDGRTGGNYTSVTVSAVHKFQAVAGLKQTGIATAEVQKALFAKGAPENPDLITLRRGDDNDRVQRMQERLNGLGYNAGAADGSYGKNTQEAVKLFQRAAGLKATGTADVETLRRLFAQDAPIYVEYEKIGVPVIALDAYAACENGVYTIDDTLDAILISWYADGDVDSYDVQIADDSGAVWVDERGVGFEMLSLPAAAIAAGQSCTVTVTAHPQDRENDSDTTASVRIARAAQPEIPEQGVGSLVILPGGSYESAEGYLVFDGDATLVWSAAGTVYGYTWRVTDAGGAVVGGYANDSVSAEESVLLTMADFAAGGVYTLAVTAYASADDAEPVTEAISFSFGQAQQEAPSGETEQDLPTGEDEQNGGEQQPVETEQPAETEQPVEPTAAPAALSDLMILPGGEYPMTEAGFLLSEDSAFSWQVTGDVYGYAYRVTDESGNGVAGYESRELTTGESLTLAEADFALDALYRLTVYAFASADSEPLTAFVPFMYPSDLNQPEGGDAVEIPEPSRRDLYRDFYGVNCVRGEGVVLADVTQDGREEMIVRLADGDYVTGYVYTVRDGSVVLLETVTILTTHGGVCAWYLAPNGESWALVEETDNIWQGYGEASFMKYTLSETGERISLSSGCLTDQEAGCVDEEGRILDFLIAEYGNMVTGAISSGYVIYRSGSMSGMPLENLYMDAAETLYGEVGVVGNGLSVYEEEGYTDGPDEAADELSDMAEDMSDAAADESVSELAGGIGAAVENAVDLAEEALDGSEFALIGLMGMTYGEMGTVLNDLNWFDSFDSPGIWSVNGYYSTPDGDVSVCFDFYEEPDGGEVYPSTMTVMDYEGVGAQVTEQLRTGMTYAEVRGLPWEALSEMQMMEDGSGLVEGYPDQGCVMSMLFDSTSDDAVLTSVTISFFE